MLAEISMGLSSAKAALDLAKGLNAAATEAAINQVKIDLSRNILEAYEALTAAREADAATKARISELEAEIVRLKDWESEKQRYELKAIDAGAFAYMPKPGMENGEPTHWLCQTCFSRRQTSILQSRGRIVGPGHRGDYEKWGCNTCKGEVVTFYTRKPSVPYPKPPAEAP